ncbi:MAG: hypothetical protein J6Q85_02465 [Clostridia bacterium]|nr:hypothetical protein [Clostridia bacterium]
MKILLDKNKNYYKANLHTHTDLSDGYRSQEDIKEAYKARGYSVVAFTDHEFLIDASHLTDSEFVALNGCELTVKENDTQSTKTNNTLRVTHLCLYAESPDNIITPCYSSKYSKKFLGDSAEGKIHQSGEYERVYSPEGISDIIRRAHDAGFLVCYNHPGWSLELDGRYLQYEGLDFVEIFNTGCVKMGFSDDEAVFSTMLLEGKNIFCTAADDCHSGGREYPLGDSFLGFVMINADTLSYENVISALKSGSFYASFGPEILSLTLDEGVVTVECSPSRKISILYRGRFCDSVHGKTNEPLTHATFRLRERTDGFRIKVEDASGRCAWSQFYGISQ